MPAPQSVRGTLRIDVAHHATMKHHAVRREYSVLASSYDRAWGRYVRDSTTLALAEFPTSPALRVLDIGCGTWVLLRRALDADTTRTALGVDITLDMLRQAAQRLPNTAPLVCASGDNVPLRAASVDLVVSTSALHYMRDPIGMLREARRLLVPGGTVIVGDWCHDYWTMSALDRVLRWVDPAHVATLSGETLVRLMRNAGFQNVRLSRRRIDRFWGLMTATAQCP
ncbi:methyltransferase domain-containing protein [soil metagenome]